MRLAVKWDSPTVTDWADAIPTQAEFTFEWATAHVQSALLQQRARLRPFIASVALAWC